MLRCPTAHLVHPRWSGRFPATDCGCRCFQPGQSLPGPRSRLRPRSRDKFPAPRVLRYRVSWDSGPARYYTGISHFPFATRYLQLPPPACQPHRSTNATRRAQSARPRWFLIPETRRRVPYTKILTIKYANFKSYVNLLSSAAVRFPLKTPKNR